MGKKIITKGICLGLGLVLFAGMTGVAFAAESTEDTSVSTSAAESTVSTTVSYSSADAKNATELRDQEATKDLYRLDSNGTYNLFTNYVQGYSLNVDEGMQVDMSYSDVCAVLENTHKRIEIYKESLSVNVGQRDYINYSNKFINNTADHTKEYETQTTINGKTVHILQWSRQKLSRVENDKNYYVSLELLSDQVRFIRFLSSRISHFI